MSKIIINVITIAFPFYVLLISSAPADIVLNINKTAKTWELTGSDTGNVAAGTIVRVEWKRQTQFLPQVPNDIFNEQKPALTANNWDLSGPNDSVANINEQADGLVLFRLVASKLSHHLIRANKASQP